MIIADNGVIQLIGETGSEPHLGPSLAEFPVFVFVVTFEPQRKHGRPLARLGNGLTEGKDPGV